MEKFDQLRKLASSLRSSSIEENLDTIGNLLEIYDDLKSKKEASEWYPFKKIIIDLLESSGLMPYVAENMGDMPLSDILRLMPYEMEDGKFFHHGQIQMLDDLLNDKVQDLAIVAPTSFGKTKLVDYYLQKKLPDRVIIVQPTIALLQETFFRLKKNRLLSNYIIVMDQEDFDENTEKWIAIWTQERCLEWLKESELKRIDFFVVDEFYLIDPRRNIPEDSEEEANDERSEILKHVYENVKPMARKTLLIGPVADSISDKSIEFRETKFTPVRQIVKPEYESWENSKASDSLKLNRLIKIINTSNKGLLVFRSSPDKAQALAKNIISKEIKPDFSIPNSVQKLCLWLDENYKDTVKDWTVYKALKKGIGVHHGQMPRSLQKLILILFNEGSLHTLIMTSTIVQGVNTVADSLVYWKNSIERSIDYFAYKNIIGRAGRLGCHITGTVYLFDRPPEEQTITIEIPTLDESEPEIDIEEELLESSDVKDAIAPRILQDFRNNFPGLKRTRIDKAFKLIEQNPDLFSKNSIRDFLKNSDREMVLKVLKFCNSQITLNDLNFKTLVNAMNAKTNKHRAGDDPDKAYATFFKKLQVLQFDLPKGLSILFKAAQHKKLLAADKAEKLLEEALVRSRFQTPSAVYALEEQGIPFHISYKALSLKNYFDNPSEPKVSELKKALMERSIRENVLMETDVFILDELLELSQLS